MTYLRSVFILCALLVCVPLHAEEPDLLKTFVEELVVITPGEGNFPKSFQMGSRIEGEQAEPVHEVTFDYSFSIAKYEVPQNLYELVMEENPSRWTGPRNSVEMMSPDEAREFCEKLTGLLRARKLIAESEIIRLPSEAEWEYCCRAGTTTVYSFGNKAQADEDLGKMASILDDFAWHTGNAAGNDPPVGALKPNPWGLYDMHGYLWEFVSDDGVAGFTDAPTDGSPRRTNDAKQAVLRGGSWKNRYDELTSSYRKMMKESVRDDAVGFRCVKSTPVPGGETGQ
ncbi:Serine/threonine-protein kinase pkn1 [Polystyrenella longa]|uniref:Serine/threonine-protein kinase pkn1 n=1 Tax=Polystyrenella longa TaxID=2528007 RepID=A0A518CU76_9PLAN|nr:formylglycine-generating enzyme family protein [Polystyrenella longa]QDU82758.1 Serine/threonine-protein kinase pkn1 [Polystyrenella longa]